jgi:tRNA1(Val) A37 N6-methylase TrmN6
MSPDHRAMTGDGPSGGRRLKLGAAALARSGSGPEVTTDGVLNHRVQIRQPATGYRVAIDPVFLAAAVPASAGSCVLDVGTGVGAAALCLLARVPGCHVVGLEIQDRLAALARDNSRLNGRADRFAVITGDLRNAPPTLGRASFSHVMANPPFHPPSLPASRLLSRDTSNHEGNTPLQAWLSFCQDMVRPDGTITIIHRPERRTELIAAFADSRISLFPLVARTGGDVRRLLVQVRLGEPPQICEMDGMILHQEDGHYSQAANGILRHAADLNLDTQGRGP